MTVSRHRRRMSTTRAVVSSVVGAALALVLGVAGAVAVYNTKDGQVQGSDIPEVRFPDTPTAALAVLDDDGSLASLAVFAVRPAADGVAEGVGGTVVPVPVSADVSGGLGTERLPLDETASLFGSETLVEEIPAVLGVSIDHTVVVDRAQLVDALSPLATTEVTLPVAATNTGGTVIADAGVKPLSGALMAAILGSRNDSISAEDEYSADFAVWQAIADAVGEGLPAPITLPAEAESPAIDESGRDFFSRVTSGPISVQALPFEPIVNVDENPRGVDAVVLDRVEVVLIFGHIAPTRVAAPYAGYSFRVISRFSDEQLPELRGYDVAKAAVEAIFELEGNVRSVEAGAGEAPDRTIIEVTNEALIAAAQGLAEVFGAVDVRVAETRIAGIDIIVTLGTDYLALLDTGAVSASTDATVPAEETTVEGTS